VVLPSFTVTGVLPVATPLTVTTLAFTETVAMPGLPGVAETAPAAWLTVAEVLAPTATDIDVGAIVIVAAAVTVTGRVMFALTASRTLTLALPAARPATFSVAPIEVKFVSETVTSAVFVLSAWIYPRAPVILTTL
jgi:hypothetical protein